MYRPAFDGKTPTGIVSPYLLRDGGRQTVGQPIVQRSGVR